MESARGPRPLSLPPSAAGISIPLPWKTGCTAWTKPIRNSPRPSEERLRSLFGGNPREKPGTYRVRSPIHEAGNLRSPVLIIHSKDSKRFPFSEAIRLAGTLEKRGLPHRFVTTRGRLREFRPGHPSIRRWVVPFMLKHLRPKIPKGVRP